MTMASHMLTHERTLYNILQHIFPETQIQINVMKTTNVKYPATGSYMQFDIWIPDYQLAFEFQDAYHFIPTWYYHNTQKYIQEKDNTKILMARKNGIRLITVPCWWPGSLSPLLSSLSFDCPDLLSLLSLVSSSSPISSDPISLNPPLDFFKANAIPDVGELMLASFPITKFSFNGRDSDWFVGEKYDGFRCCWNPIRQMAYTRYGKEISLFPSLFKFLPAHTFLDCELWFGRGQFSFTFLLTKEISNSYWHTLRMVAFDSPSVALERAPFEERYHHLLLSISPTHPFSQVAMRMQGNGGDIWLEKRVNDILKDGGEGLIVQRLTDPYYRGRTLSVVKLKISQSEQEGLILSLNADQSVTLKMPNGIKIRIEGTEVLEDPAKLQVGLIATIGFALSSRRDSSSSSGVRLFRVRRDLSWADVKNDFARDQHLSGLNAPSRYTTHPVGYWTHNKMREYMINFAQSRNEDPMQADTWYNCLAAFRLSSKGKIILGKFKNDFGQLIHNLFPEIKFDKDRLFNLHWNRVESRRRFFENYAEANRFDFQVAENWYKQSKEAIFATKGARRVVFYHNGSITKALLDLFPNIGLEASKLRTSLSLLRNIDNRRRLLEKYAAGNQFDPYQPENWYSQSKSKIMSTKGVRDVLAFHHDSLVKALIELFPQIGFDKRKLEAQLSMWVNEEARRTFFVNYAKENGFDPLDPNGWYTQSKRNILNQKSAHKVIYFHGDSVARALIELFPSIGLDRAKLQARQSAWFNSEKRRKFFEMYAADNQFDPLVAENWYFQAKEKIISLSNANKVLQYHNNSLSKALSDLFPDIGLDIALLKVRQSTWQYTENRRKFFETYAAANDFDPLIADNWYFQSKDKILQTKNSSDVLFFHENSLSKALLELFPDIGLYGPKLHFRQAQWSDSDTRRYFFEKYAKENGFDPLVAHNWYMEPKDKILRSKGAREVIFYHENSVAKALLELFPDVHLEHFKLLSGLAAWSKAERRKEFFESYAQQHQFDPLLAENWYLQSSDSIMAHPGAKGVLYYYDNSITKALLAVFPNISFDKVKLRQCLSLWNDPENRKRFFIDFAKENGFDPLVPENWYSCTRDNIMAKKDATKVIHFHNSNLTTALIDLFPDIGLDKSTLQIRQSPWSQAKKRREFFESYASMNGFDPLVAENWYSHSKLLSKKLLFDHDVKGSFGVLFHHGNSVTKALVDLFPEIGIDIHKLHNRKSDWSKLDTQKDFFLKYANQNGFDPYNPDNWYKQSKAEITATEGVSKVLYYHGNSITAALLACFPNIGFQKSKLNIRQSQWYSPEKRRGFFEEFAKGTNRNNNNTKSKNVFSTFDPLVTAHWYDSGCFRAILNAKGAQRVLFYHKNSIAQALWDLFPDLGFDLPKLLETERLGKFSQRL